MPEWFVKKSDKDCLYSANAQIHPMEIDAFQFVGLAGVRLSELSPGEREEARIALERVGFGGMGDDLPSSVLVDVWSVEKIKGAKSDRQALEAIERAIVAATIIARR